MKYKPPRDLVGKTIMYCRKCRYRLCGLPQSFCPECGRPFDLSDPGSFYLSRWEVPPLFGLCIIFFGGLLVFSAFAALLHLAGSAFRSILSL